MTKSPDQPEYAIGTTVTLTAVPAAGYQFTRWEGPVAGSNNPTQVVISMTSLVRAVFTAVR